MADKLKWMLFAVLAVLFFSYTAFLYRAGVPESTKATASSDRGKRLWQEYNCGSCHQVYGLGGYLGPDLTNVFSQKGKDHIAAFLKSGTNIMPDFHLTDKEINDLTNYLESIDASGKADPRKFKKNYDGTIEP